MPLKVLKFGGSSVGTPERIRVVAKRISNLYAAGDTLVVVVSAMADTTDDLVDLAEKVSATPSEREMDMLLTAGERISMSLLSMALSDLRVPAVSFTGSQSGILTTSRHGRARIERILGDRIRSALAERKVAIVAGFQGVSREKEITTLGRGGSDTTAVALAVTFGAEVCEIFTDVEGIYSADPKKVPDAFLQFRIPGDLMVELASRGADVLHVRSAELAFEKKINLQVRNSFSEGEGTRMLNKEDSTHLEEFQIVGVTSDLGKALIELRGLRAHGLWKESREQGLSLLAPLFMGDSAATFVDRTSLSSWKMSLEKLIRERKLESFAVREDQVPVSLVGYRFLQDGAALNELTETLAESGILVTMGSASALGATVGVHRDQADKAVQLLHERFLGHSLRGESMKASHIVIGEGLAAQGSVALLLERGEKVVWIAGSGARVRAVLPAMETGLAVETLKKVCSFLGIELGDEQNGTFVREFRNKAFREPAWFKAAAEHRAETIKELLWGPEQNFVSAQEVRFAQDMGQIEDIIRAALLSGAYENLTRVEGFPVAEIKIENGRATRVLLGSGEMVECASVTYADRWSGPNSLATVQGLPKPLMFTRRREPVGILQATFVHHSPIGAGTMEGFFGTLARDASQKDTDPDRHFYGYFSADGKQSQWTLALTPEESEDNHEIAKRYRKMKAGLDKMFVGEPWLSATSFLANIQTEHVRFEEGVASSEGEPVSKPLALPKVDGLSFVTDSYGNSHALMQLADAFGIQAEQENETLRRDSAPLIGSDAPGPNS